MSTFDFFASRHQTIKGWHTFFKGRPGENVGNLTLMSKSGWKADILVVLCGRFTSKQGLLTREKISVNPHKVIAGWLWLKANNFRYVDIKVLHIDDIMLPYMMTFTLTCVHPHPHPHPYPHPHPSMCTPSPIPNQQ
jgi:hypothetical protein